MLYRALSSSGSQSTEAWLLDAVSCLFTVGWCIVASQCCLLPFLPRSCSGRLEVIHPIRIGQQVSIDGHRGSDKTTILEENHPVGIFDLLHDQAATLLGRFMSLLVKTFNKLGVTFSHCVVFEFSFNTVTIVLPRNYSLKCLFSSLLLQREVFK